MLFNHGLEILGCRRPVRVSLHEVMHSGSEILVPGATIPHHHADHVKNVCALWIDKAPSNALARAGVAHAVSHGDGTGVDRTPAFFIALQQYLPLVVPEADELRRIFFNQL